MRLLHLRWLWLGLIVFLSSPIGVAEAANPLPAVFVEGLAITSQTESEVAGSFTISNQDESAYANLQYEIQLISQAPEKSPGTIVADNYIVYDVRPGSEVLSVAGAGTKLVSFVYPLPSVPAGTYRLRIQLKTENERELGWDDVVVTMTKEVADFVTLDPAQIQVPSVDPITGAQRSTWAPLEGPNVAPGANLSLEILASVSGQTAVTGTWQVEVERLLTASAQPISIPPAATVTVQPGVPTLTAVPLTAQSEPGAYRVVVSLQNAAGARLSGVAEFRYVVQGASASLLPHSIPSPRFGRGETVEVLFGVAGPADRISTFTGTVEVALFDGETALGTTQEPIEVSQAEALSGTATIELAAPVCNQLRSMITLRDASGAVVDQAEASYADLPVPACGSLNAFGWKQISLWAIGAIILLAIIFALVRVWQRRHAPTIGTPSLWLLGAVMASGGLLISHSALANGIQFSQGSAAGTSLWINTPTHDQAVAGQTAYEARLDWVNSLSSGGFAHMSLSSRSAGGKVSTLPRDANGNYTLAPGEWRLEGESFDSGETVQGSHAFQTRRFHYSTTLFLPNPAPYPDTTLLTSLTTQTLNPEDESGAVYDLTWLRFTPDEADPEAPRAQIDLTGDSCLGSIVTANGSNSFDPAGVSPKGVIADYHWEVTGPDGNQVVYTEEKGPGGTNNCQPGEGDEDGGDGTMPDTRISINFTRLVNEGQGNVKPQLFLGGDGGEKIVCDPREKDTDGYQSFECGPFYVVKDGAFIEDDPFDPDDADVPGVAVRRGRGFVEFVDYGFWPEREGSMEIVYGNVRLQDGSTIQSLTTKGVETQGDGKHGRNLPAGERDEVYWTPGDTNARFFLHATKRQDAFTIFYATGPEIPGEPGGGDGDECPDPFASKITFQAVASGVYPITLKVDDYDGLSGTAATSATALNNPPVPLIAPVPRIVARERVTLDGTKSFDPDTRCGDFIKTWEWTVTDPKGDAVLVENADESIASFEPPLAGEPYTATLKVWDNHDEAQTRTQALGVDLRGLVPPKIQETE